MRMRLFSGAGARLRVFSALFTAVITICSCHRPPIVGLGQTAVYTAVTNRFVLAYHEKAGFYLKPMCRANTAPSNPDYSWVRLEQVTLGELVAMERERPRAFRRLNQEFLRRARRDGQFVPEYGMYPTFGYGVSLVEELLRHKHPWILREALRRIPEPQDLTIPPLLNETNPDHTFLVGMHSPHIPHVPLHVCSWGEISVNGDPLDVLAHNALMGRIPEFQDLADSEYQRRVQRLVRRLQEDFPLEAQPADLLQRKEGITWSIQVLHERAREAGISLFVQRVRAELEARGVNVDSVALYAPQGGQ
jgi:hypothetical protein